MRPVSRKHDEALLQRTVKDKDVTRWSINYVIHSCRATDSLKLHWRLYSNVSTNCLFCIYSILTPILFDIIDKVLKHLSGLLGTPFACLVSQVLRKVSFLVWHRRLAMRLMRLILRRKTFILRICNIIVLNTLHY